MTDFLDRILLDVSTEPAPSPALDALEQLVCAYPLLDQTHATMPQQRALRFAKLVLVEAGRKVRP